MITEVKAFTITCKFAYGDPEGKFDAKPSCDQKNLGPFFRQYRHEVPLPKGWIYHTVHGCGLTGYSRTDVVCGRCAKRLGLTPD